MKQNHSFSNAILNQLIDLIVQLKNDEYSEPLSILSNNSIGKHIRHIIEFYECLLLGIETGIINYDARNRNTDFETKCEMALQTLQNISIKLQFATDCRITLHSTYNTEVDPIISQTSFSRELVYNVEHAVHHMAILRIAINAHFPLVILPYNFGVAYSTIQHQREQCAQ
jgi:hypothetical protein